MWRFKLIFFIFLLVGLAVLARLFYWQVIISDQLKAAAESQHWGVFDIPAPRGKIFTSDGFTLVGNQTAYLVYLTPSEVKNKKETLGKLAEILDTDEASLSARFSDTLAFIPVKHKVEEKIVEKLKDLDLPGVGFRKEEKRFYPEGSMSAHLLGFVGSDISGRDTGYFGIEGFYNTELSGLPGFLRQEKDAAGQPILLGNWRFYNPRPGHSLVLTLDRAVQFMVEEKLKEGVKRFGAKSGLVVIIEPKTGKIIAMASYPTYAPDNWQEFDEELFKNPVILDRYEPGSTFKVITMAAGLDLGIIEPGTVCDRCSGPREIGGFVIRTYNDEYYPTTNMIQVLEHSDNVGIVFVAERLGLAKFYQYLTAFGFGEETGIDLQEEARADLRPKRDWYPIDVATAGFGQGIAVTPIQMIRAVAAIANGGQLMRPYVVQKIMGAQEIEIKPKVIRRVIKPETARTLTEMMVSAVDNSQLRYFKPAGFRIAGKTGTAQVPIAGHYDPQKTVASMVGFAPADDPRFAMLVRFTEPTASPWGATTAAPVFFDIARELFAYYGIGPTK